MEWLSFGLLALALAAFLASTRQFALRARAAIWAVGLALLVGSAAAAFAWPGHAGLFRFLGGLIQGDATALRALPRDWPSVAGAVAPMIDVFLLFGGVLAIVALLAFSPGEAMEKAIRPLMIGVIGAIGGALFALIMVTSGFAGYFQQRFYLSEAAQIYDGDTMRMGDVSLRLAGVDAPERRQTCISSEGLPWQCGEDARQHLIGLMRGAMVFCEPIDAPAGDEALGAPPATCIATAKNGEEFDIGERMVADGYAAIFPDAGGPDYFSLFETAQRERKGVLVNCTLAPSEWRNNAAARIAFESYNPGILAGAPTIGACETLIAKSVGK